MEWNDSKFPNPHFSFSQYYLLPNEDSEKANLDFKCKQTKHKWGEFVHPKRRKKNIKRDTKVKLFTPYIIQWKQKCYEGNYWKKIYKTTYLCP